MVQSTTLLLIAIPLALASIAGTHIVGRRRFYRRNQAGIEQFRSYGNKLATTALESLVTGASRLCLAVAFVLLGIFAFMRATDKQGLDLSAPLSLPHLSSFIQPHNAPTNEFGDRAQTASGGAFRERPVSKRPSHQPELQE